MAFLLVCLVTMIGFPTLLTWGVIEVMKDLPSR